MDDSEFHERADQLAMDIEATLRESRAFLDKHRVPPPRSGKYENAMGAIPIDDLENYNNG